MEKLPVMPQELLMPRRTVRAGVETLLQEAAAFGTRGALAHGRSLQASGTLARILDAAPPGMSVATYAHTGQEPTTREVDAFRAFLRGQGTDWVAAVGGGSVMDLAKAAAGLLEGTAPAADYVSGKEKVPGARVPLLMAPATAGTGSEATVVAVLTDAGRGVKASIRHATLMPQVVVLDASLLASCPPAVLAASGLDAFTQAVESHISRHATPFTRALSELAAQHIADALPGVFKGDFTRADALMEGSFLAGVALSHARLGLAHGLAHPLGCRWRAAHGLVCALCLPAVLRFNRGASRVQMERLAALLGRDVEALVAEWLGMFGLPNVFAGGVIADRDAVIAETLASGSTKANPREVAAGDVSAVLDEIFASTRQ